MGLDPPHDRQAIARLVNGSSVPQSCPVSTPGCLSGDIRFYAAEGSGVGDQRGVVLRVLQIGLDLLFQFRMQLVLPSLAQGRDEQTGRLRR